MIEDLFKDWGWDLEEMDRQLGKMHLKVEPIESTPKPPEEIPK